MHVNEWISLNSHTLSHTLSASEAERSDNHMNTLSSTPLTSLIPFLLRFLTTASASVCGGAFKVVIHTFFYFSVQGTKS